MTFRDDEFEIDFEQLISDNGMLDAMFYLRDLKDRKLYFNEDVKQYTVAEAVRHILYWNQEDYGKSPEERKPIRIYLVSNGGEVDSGFELIDAIRMSKTPVYTINLGYQYSMGFLIGLAGHKRFAMPNAKYLLHDGTQFVYNSGAKVRDQMLFQDEIEARLRAYIIETTNITAETYDSHLRVEWYMFADEAKKNGCVDYIVGEDCQLEDIL